MVPDVFISDPIASPRLVYLAKAFLLTYKVAKDHRLDLTEYRAQLSNFIFPIGGCYFASIKCIIEINDSKHNEAMIGIETSK